jgi:phosphate transport system protein
MTVHLQREVDRLKKEILALGALVEESVDKAVRAVTERDLDLAQEVIDSDSVIDETEVDVEEHCLQILALYQPVAGDLRFIVSVLKLNNDLERIGDLAVNVAETCQRMHELGQREIPFDFVELARRVSSMLERSLDALVHLDTALAWEVCAADSEVDILHRGVYRKVHDRIQQEPEAAERLLPTIALSRQLERIADHATNIAEDVIYLVDGRIHRHGM